MNEDTIAHLPDGFRGLLIGIPNVSGYMRTELAAALIKAGILLTKLEIPLSVYWVIGSSAVERARNSIIEEFMRRDDFNWLLMIDDDMDFEHTAILKILSNKHPVCYAAGVKKKAGSDAPPDFAIYPVGRENPICPDCGCIEMAAGGCCFVLISKDAIRQLLDAFPNLKYRSEIDPDQFIPALFNPELDDNYVYRAEDVAFYQRWRSIGGKVFLDASIDLGHWGSARWSGDIRKSFTYQGDDRKD